MVMPLMPTKTKTSSSVAPGTQASQSAPSRAVDDCSQRVFIGTSGWSYTSWKPDFYPRSVPSKKFLEYYATQLNSVEVNYTFRQLPSDTMIEGWLAAGDPGFRFSFKAPQRITHFRRLKNCAEEVAALAQALKPVAAVGRMGVVLFQLPPNFKADVPRLEAFLLDAGVTGLRVAFEFRHASWFSDETYAALQRHGAALCVAESDDLKTPDVVTAPFACYRFRKSGYGVTQLKAIAKILRNRAAAGEVFAYFKHEKQPTGAIAAVLTLRRLRRK
jgi:uncharacterized protein YecE (DUF72 family)